MSKELQDALRKMPVGKAEAFLLRALDQLGQKGIGAVANGRKKLVLADLSAAHLAVSVKTNTIFSAPIPYSRLLEITSHSEKVLINQGILHDLFGIKMEEIPPIKAFEWEIERYLETGHVFLYWPGGLSMKDIYEKLTPKYKGKGWGKVLFNTDWYEEESFFTKPIPAGWMAFSLSPIPDTGGKSFLQQTQILKDFVCKQLYQRKALPSQIKEAVQEFDKKKYEEVHLLIKGNRWQEGAEMLSNLKINQIFCPPSPAEELLFSSTIRFQMNKNIFNGIWGWTSTLSSHGSLFLFVHSYANGAYVSDNHPRYSYSLLRRFSFRRF